LAAGAGGDMHSHQRLLVLFTIIMHKAADNNGRLSWFECKDDADLVE